MSYRGSRSNSHSSSSNSQAITPEPSTIKKVPYPLSDSSNKQSPSPQFVEKYLEESKEPTPPGNFFTPNQTSDKKKAVYKNGWVWKSGDSKGYTVSYNTSS